MITIGVISDTHGLVRPEALDALAGCARILHAGDVGAPDVLEALARIAPVIAVRGNNDHGGWARALREREIVEIEGRRILVVHQMAHVGPPRGVSAVITGHSHRPSNEVRDGVLYLNPGAAGPRRFSLPVTVARLTVSTRRLAAEIVPLAITPRAR